MDAQLRVGLVGAGPWARTVHAPGLAEHPGTSLTAVWTRRPEVASALAEEHCTQAATSFEELLDQVDAVAFAVPPSVQAEYAVLAAKAGKHLILEKPLAHDVDSARRVADAVAEADVVALLMLTMRYTLQTREWLAGLGEAGGWKGGNARWLSGALLGEKYGNSPWRQAEGSLSDIGPHTFDLLDAALGEITAVLAAHRDAGDLWHVLLEHESGATSTVALTTRLPMRPTVTEFAVYGDSGFRSLSRKPGLETESFTALLDDFAAMIASGVRTHDCDATRGLHLQRILAMCLEAARLR
ncbi:Gfo/Idh/MocA family protein [Prauserella cavernicola]|uniref:Gfo/Idh/MocA family oxidoreductase n=1 Tax=Prauserella cavernicola TaxID=2800127 RepID=A0A934QRI9_9PSEU|nr:Gfo/Idh/MocA family oxidoreductase [Prauserella cavernicola]MBK1784833.1 Gfo/Idh/MocA family oxidoreductase [Prauserella cavernicola]